MNIIQVLHFPSLRSHKVAVAILIFFVILLLFPTATFAQNISCDNRYLTIINPIRGRELWFDKSVKPLEDQSRIIKEGGLVATWLLQYDTLSDVELTNVLSKLKNPDEIGVFLEVSRGLAEDADVVYPYDAPWFSPKVIFFSAYSQSERVRMADQLFLKFKDRYGHIPTSVGAWWVDSYTLNYLKQKYGVKAVLIVADQKTTDNYGVWGGWWGVPYVPSKANILTPASTKENKQDLVVVQWAQRDPLLAYGEGYKFSNQSLQANDYISLGKTTDHFKKLSSIYLDCKNKVGQITVGLETGQESFHNLPEFKNQIDHLSSIKNLKPVTLSLFSDEFKKIYPTFPEKSLIGESNEWLMTLDKRENEILNDLVYYQADRSFSDYYIADKSLFLNRILPLIGTNPNKKEIPILYVFILSAIISWILLRKSQIIWLTSLFFTVASFGLIIRSFSAFGWNVYYGPVAPYPFLVVVPLLGLFFLNVTLKMFKYSHDKPLLLLGMPLIFGLDYILKVLRLSYISDKYYFGISIGQLDFKGLLISKTGQLQLVSSKMPSFLAAGLLRFDFNKIWDNFIFWAILYPLVHLLLGFLLVLILNKLPRRYRIILLVAFSLLFLLWLYSIFTADPRQVAPI